MDMKASLDPKNHFLPSWTINGDPCGESFEGVACNEKGQVVNISLQGKGLSGKLSSAIAGLKHLTGLYLHYNSLNGEIPRDVSNLTQLSELYLNVNQFYGEIPFEIGSMENLQVLQLSYNQLTGRIPTQLGALKKLTVVALKSNQLTGAIPASLGDLNMLVRLDLSSNNLIGSIPTSLASVPSLKVLDVHNNTLSGNVPPVLAIGILAFTIHLRRRKQYLENSLHISDSRPSTDKAKGIYRKNESPLPCLEYSTRSDPLVDYRDFDGDSQYRFRSFMFNLEEVELATQNFADSKLLGKSEFCATYKGVLRDGSIVAVKRISKNSCKYDEEEVMKILNSLASMRNDNLVRLRGFCCSRERDEWFLIYDFVPNGKLSRFLDLQESDEEVLEWSTRVSIAKGIAKGMAYLHSNKANKPIIIHQNISSDKILINQRYNPLLDDYGLYKLLTNDIVFSALKPSATKGYMAPEYATTSRFSEASDVYAFGMVLFQILSGKKEITSSIRLAAESFNFKEFMDPNLNGRFFECDAAKLTKIALFCMHESPFERPSMEAIVKELSNCTSCL
ncbi:putative LRR receptor-like protein kinase [Trifolium pratense]|uniref:Putative LRR receptor-like protein kinase n=1 Tax=Trifolium pratense TaxID=57577 RepID=A0A2K3MPJ6_TRIPR|nr:putative LRR receptor-like protein kinase [Trifolium pratense]